MAKVITFSRTFPAYHPKKGLPTYFVEKFCKSVKHRIFDTEREFNPRLSLNEFDPKHHTIRSGHRWKAGDYFSPRVWSGKPYNSPQIKIAPDTLIVKTWDFEVTDKGYFYLNGRRLWTDFNTPVIQNIFEISKNDGLESEDLLEWFQYPKPFKGQIICWNESINY